MLNQSIGACETCGAEPGCNIDCLRCNPYHTDYAVVFGIGDSIEKEFQRSRADKAAQGWTQSNRKPPEPVVPSNPTQDQSAARCQTCAAPQGSTTDCPRCNPSHYGTDFANSEHESVVYDRVYIARLRIMLKRPPITTLEIPGDAIRLAKILTGHSITPSAWTQWVVEAICDLALAVPPTQGVLNSVLSGEFHSQSQWLKAEIIRYLALKLVEKAKAKRNQPFSDAEKSELATIFSRIKGQL